jgi:glycosyltransferase involved in cell wall biosynthesis
MGQVPFFMCQVTVLLASYNGELFLESFLDSVLSQTLSPIIYVRDDGSKDNTLQILANRGNELVFLDKYIGNVGILENFNILAEETSAPYLAFADQDDIWEPDKLAVQMELMFRMEAQHGQDMPILIHSDLAVCDSRLRLVDSSLWRFQRLNPYVQNFSRLLVQNNITGCTMLINKALKDLAFPVPQAAVMHDWWLALVASAVGKIGFVPRPLVRYRQHDANQLGAVRSDLKGAIKRLNNTNPQSSLGAAQRQAQAFCECFNMREDMAAALKLADVYAKIHAKSYAQRLWSLYRYGFWKQDLLRNIGLVLYI